MEIIDTPLPPINIFLRSSEYTSKDAYKSNLTFELNKPIQPYPIMDILIGLESFQFTNSFYTINENSCNIAYTIYPSILSKTYALTFGNYDIDSFIAYLNTSISDLVFSYDQSTLKISIKSSVSTTFTLDTINNNAYELLGFDDFGTSINKLVQIAPYMFNMISIQVLHICTPNIMLNSYGLKNKTKHNIIGSVQVTSSSGEVQTYINTFKNKIHSDPITFISINIYNQDFNVVNFNNIDWFINIFFIFIYRKKLEMPQYLGTFNIDSNMKYYLEDEETRNNNNILDTILDHHKLKSK